MSNHRDACSARRRFLLGLASAGVCGALPALVSSVLRAQEAPAPSRPNVILLLADDLGYMDIGANNPQSFYETPHLDRLAARGMRFTNGYAACPVCSPTRASLLTGRSPPRTGVTNILGPGPTRRMTPAPCKPQLALEEHTLAEALRTAGYETFFAGKWHLGDGAFSPRAQGFSPDLVGTEQFYYPPATVPPPPAGDDPKSTDRIVNEAVSFITSHKDKPFFAFLSFPAVHIPLGARADLVEKYKAKRARAPRDAWGDERGNRVRLVQSNVTYAAMVEQMDTAIGRVLEAVERQGLSDRTILIFTSDNGGLCTTDHAPTANVPLRAGKGWLYEGGIREPLFIRAPGVTRPGAVCDTPVITHDLYPTILQLAGLPLNPHQHRDGLSLLPLLRGEPFRRGPLFWHFPHYGNQNGGLPGGAVRDGDWKLIEWYEDGRLELYHLARDPGEKSDLAEREPAKARELHEKLAAWRREVRALMPTARERGAGARGRKAGR